MTQTTLPLIGPHSLEAELAERCPLCEVVPLRVTRDRFDWCVIQGVCGGDTVIRVEKQFWSQARIAFIAEYDKWVEGRNG